MTSDCESVRVVVFALVGREGPVISDPTEADVESAFRHLKWCRTCRSALSPEDLSLFIRNAILERE